MFPFSDARRGDLVEYRGGGATRPVHAGTTVQALGWDANGDPLAKTLDQTYLSFGAWTTYTPTVTAGSGTFTSVAAVGHYIQMGKTLFWQMTITITTNGTAAGNVLVNLPGSLSAVVNWPISGRATGVSGKSLNGVVTGQTAQIWNYDNSYPASSGEVLNVSGVIEVS